MFLISGETLLGIIRRQTSARLDRLMALLPADSQMSDSGRGPPEKQTVVIVCSHGDVEIKRDVAAEVVVVESQGFA